MAIALNRLAQRAQRKASRLRGACAAFETERQWPNRDVLATYIAIQASNLWAWFARTLYLECVLNNALTGHGSPVTLAVPRPVSQREAILLALDCFNTKLSADIRASGRSLKPRDEPSWQDKNIYIKIVNAIGLSNEPSILSAINASVRSLENVPTIRNFYAHRSDETAMKASKVQLRYGIATSVHPTDFLGARIAGQPQSIARLIVDEISVATTIACF